MLLESAALAGSAGFAAWAVRGRSASILAPSVWKGVLTRPSIALTFDDGPSESTPEILDLLAEYSARATFFQCGSNASRLSAIARDVVTRGHEVGNHTETHTALHFRSPAFIAKEVQEAQASIERVTGVRPKLFRPPFGVRWVGLRGALKQAGLRNVMWTRIASDWRLSTDLIVLKLISGARAGAILCLHDGRETRVNPNVRPTIEAVRRLIPELLDRGFDFETVSEILCPTPPKRPI